MNYFKSLQKPLKLHSEGRGHRFESCRARQNTKKQFVIIYLVVLENALRENCVSLRKVYFAHIVNTLFRTHSYVIVWSGAMALTPWPGF